MKHFLLFLLLIVLNLFGQQDSALKFYDKGIIAINEEKFKLADSLLTCSLRIPNNQDPYFNRADAYYNRAIAREKLGNIIGFCDDLYSASRLGDNKANITLCKRCYDNIDSVSKSGERIYQLNFAKKVSKPFGINFKTKENYLSQIQFDPIKTINETLIKPDNKGIYAFCEIPAHFPGGDSVLNKFIKNNLIIPSRVTDKGLRGGVMLEFVVSENGNVSQIKVFKPMDNCIQCSTEAINLAKLMPPWIPGVVKGKAVKSYVPLLIPFGK